MTGRKIWQKLQPIREELYNSPEKMLIDTYPMGTGKTVAPIVHYLRNNRNNVIGFNDHMLTVEKYKDLIEGRYGRDLLKFVSMINVLYGKTANVEEYIQMVLGYPSCLCNNFLRNRENKLLYVKNYLLGNYCQDICPYRFECFYKDHISRSFKIVDLYPDLNNLWMLPKAYLSTNIPNTIAEKYSDAILILDENFFNSLYAQINIYPKSIHIFIELLNLVSSRYKPLNEFRKVIVNFLLELYKILVAEVELKTNKKIKIISQRLDEILDSWKVKDLITCNEQFKELSGNYLNKVIKTFNLISYLIQILENMEKQRENKINITIDKSNNTLSYYIDKLDDIKELFEKFYKVIITDTIFNQSILEAQFPEYINNYKTIGDTNNKIKQQFNDVFILHKNYSKSKKYGTYPKNILFKPFTGYSTTFYDLVDITNQIIEYEAVDLNHTTGLLITYKQFMKEIKKKINPVLNKFGVDMKYNWFYNVEGKGYIECDYGNIFGSVNKPQRVRDIFSKIYGIDKKELEMIWGDGQYLQCAGRFRTILREKDNLPNLYVLTNAYTGYFDNEINFEGINKIKYRDLLSWITKQNGVTTKEVEEYLNKPNQSVLNILEDLESEGLLTREKRSVGRGRPSWIWKIQ